MQNSRLDVPRILSSSRFLDLCPADGRPTSSAFASAAESTDAKHTSHRHLCLVLLLNRRHQKKSQNRVLLDIFRSSIHPSIPHTLNTPLGLSNRLPNDLFQILSPAYIFIDRQAVWLANISTSSTCPSCFASLGLLLALWRISSRILALRLLPQNASLHPVEINSREGYTGRLKKLSLVW